MVCTSSRQVSSPSFFLLRNVQVHHALVRCSVPNEDVPSHVSKMAHSDQRIANYQPDKEASILPPPIYTTTYSQYSRSTRRTIVPLHLNHKINLFPIRPQLSSPHLSSLTTRLAAGNFVVSFESNLQRESRPLQMAV